MKLPQAALVIDRIRTHYAERTASLASEAPSWPEVLELLRCCFVLGSEGPSYVQRGEELLRKLPPAERRKPEAQAFQAAFLALSAKYALWPLEKFNKVNQALAQFDRLERQHPDNLEVLFLILAVTSRVPVVFHRKAKTAQLAHRVNELYDRQGTELLSADWQAYTLDFLLRNGLRRSQ